MAPWPIEGTATAKELLPQAREHSKKEALAAWEAKGLNANDREVDGFPRV